MLQYEPRSPSLCPYNAGPTHRAPMPVQMIQSDFPAPFSASPPDILAGTLTLYQLYDIGDAIDLDLAQVCLAEPQAQRRALPPTRQAESIQIAEPPLRV